jgi:hypothetical protein
VKALGRSIGHRRSRGTGGGDPVSKPVRSSGHDQPAFLAAFAASALFVGPGAGSHQTG